MSPHAISPGGYVRGSKNDPPARPVNVQVAVRCRPINARERKQGERSVLQCDESRREISCNASLSKRGVITNGGKKYNFDHVFGPNVGQEQVYETVCESIVTEVLQGYNCTVFAYGQTGTGKTHTMEGRRDEEIVEMEDRRLPENAGIIPRAIKQVFDYLRSINEEYTVRVSHVELYNEQITDLLSVKDVDFQESLRIYEDAQKGTFVQGMEEVVVRSEEEIFEVLDKSAVRRKTAETLMNKYSSRSHSVFTVTIHIKESTPDGQDLLKVGKLNLVDLAGSENVGRSGAIRGRAREAGNINQSLLTLGRVITSLVDHHPHVPYRDSKLTRLLQESLGGRNKTCIIATVTPGASSFEESASTLDYAYRARSIKNRPQINQMITKHALLKEYNEEISKLKAELHATRTKNGVYLPPEQYELLQNTTSSQEQWIKDLREKTEEIEKRHTALKVTLARTQNALARNQKELQATQEELSNTRENLSLTKTELKEMTYARDEANHIIGSHENRGSALYGEAEALKGTLGKSLKDVESLQNRCRIKNELEKKNVEGVATLRETLAKGVELLKRNMVELKTKQDAQFESFKNTSNSLSTTQKESISSSTRAITALMMLFRETSNDIVAGAEEHEQETGARRKDIASCIKDGMASSNSKLNELRELLNAELRQVKENLNNISKSSDQLHDMSRGYAASALALSLQHSEEGVKQLDQFNNQITDELREQERIIATESKQTEESTNERMLAVRKMQETIAAKVSEALGEFVTETGIAMDAVKSRSQDQAQALNSAVLSVRSVVSDHLDDTKKRHESHQEVMELQQLAFKASAEAEANASSTLVEEVADRSESAFATQSKLINATALATVETAEVFESRMDGLEANTQVHLGRQKALIDEAVSRCDDEASKITNEITVHGAHALETIDVLEKCAKEQVDLSSEHVEQSTTQTHKNLSDPLQYFKLSLDAQSDAPPLRKWDYPHSVTKLEVRETLQNEFRRQQCEDDIEVVDLNKNNGDISDVTEDTIPRNNDEHSEESDLESRSGTESRGVPTAEPGTSETTGSREQSLPLKDETNTLRRTRLPRSATTSKELTDLMKPPAPKSKLKRSMSTQIARSGLRKPRRRIGRQAA